MSKSKDAKKDVKKEALKSPKEKKEEKRLKKASKRLRLIVLMHSRFFLRSDKLLPGLCLLGDESQLLVALPCTNFSSQNSSPC